MRYRLTPWWVKVLVIFAASRIVTTVILLSSLAAAANPWTGAHPDYFSFAQIWDGTWYNIVAVSGYPTTLPVDSLGHVEQNAWAFLPVYPFLCGRSWRSRHCRSASSGWVVSVGFAAGTRSSSTGCCCRARLVDRAVLGRVVLRRPALADPPGRLRESMQLFFLACALLYLLRRNYWMLLPYVAVMSFTRPTGSRSRSRSGCT
ncbi:MAG: hypothetical protein WDM88_12015 [Galbitalea sp.]